MVGVIIERMSHRLQYPVFDSESWDSRSFYNPRGDVDLVRSISKDEYADIIDKRSKRISELQCKMCKKKKSLVLVFEGWDAAGKGGCIKRVTRAMSPRAYKAVSYGAPTDAEKAHTYMWRFASAIPEPGNVTIFDRSWYGRMMVEPIEGLCTEEEYDRSAKEINLFEMSMAAADITILKFWLEISPEEQLERFKSRESDPLKNWKITDEDWRNRAKWDDYNEYVDRMIERTNTPWAPWVVISAEDKRNGRIEVMDAIISALEDLLG
jgi:polyphosphate kinase 2 (PPK2 family)